MKQGFKYSLSIITIVYNGDIYIEETVKSVVLQKNDSIQYIVIDGGSSDNTLMLLNKYRASIDVFISEPDSGIYNAINKGISYAEGKYVALLHCGDYYEQNSLAKISKAAQLNDASVIYSDIFIIEKVAENIIKRKQNPNHLMLKSKMSIFHPSTLVLNSIYRNYGVYSEKYILASDYDFLLKLFIANVDFLYLPLSYVNFRNDGISSKMKSLSIKENFDIRLKRIGIASAIKYYIISNIVYTYFEFRKKIFHLLLGEHFFNKLKVKYYNK